MSNLLLIIYVFVLVYNPIMKFIPYGNYADEIICVFLVSWAMLRFLSNKKGMIVRVSDETKIILMCGIVFLVGILSNVVYNYANVWNVIKDILGTFKFFITYCSGMYLAKKYKSHRLKIKLIRTAKFGVIIIFLFSIVSLFVDIGMGDSIRYGIRSFRFVYTHYTYLVFNEVLLLTTIMCEEKKNYIYYGMSFAALILTLRTKAALFIVIVIGVSFFCRDDRKISFKTLFKARYIIPLCVVGILIARGKVKEYLSWGVSNSIRVGLHYEGLRIMRDFFPLGSGFATYGTNLSYKTLSPIYMKYGMLNYQDLLYYGGATISDVYWPSIYAQFGLIGGMAFVAALFYCLRGIMNRACWSTATKKALVCILLYMLVGSTAEAVFSNESGVFAPVVMILLTCLPASSKCKIEQAHRKSVVKF